MTFASQKDAKEFLAQRVIQEAKRQGVTLSTEDQRLLYFSEAEPETVRSISHDRLDGDEQEYEAKVVELLRSAYERDELGPDGPRYAEAARKLREGDHYLSVMADEALGEADEGLGRTHRLRDYILYILIGVGLVLAILASVMLTSR